MFDVKLLINPPLSKVPKEFVWKNPFGKISSREETFIIIYVVLLLVISLYKSVELYLNINDFQIRRFIYCIIIFWVLISTPMCVLSPPLEGRGVG